MLFKVLLVFFFAFFEQKGNEFVFFLLLLVRQKELLKQRLSFFADELIDVDPEVRRNKDLVITEVFDQTFVIFTENVGEKLEQVEEKFCLRRTVLKLLQNDMKKLDEIFFSSPTHFHSRKRFL